jgi:hypothetical protein
LICDSIGKHVKHIPNCHYYLQAYPGATIEDIDYFISSGSASVNFDIVLIHVGTNNANSCKLSDFDYLYNSLICTIMKFVKPSTKIICSAIIPRPLDYDVTMNFVIAINNALKNICFRRHCEFVATYKPFLKFGRPVWELYSPLCNLHPNNSGNIKLTNFNIQVISHCKTRGFNLIVLLYNRRITSYSVSGDVEIYTICAISMIKGNFLFCFVFISA